MYRGATVFQPPFVPVTIQFTTGTGAQLVVPIGATLVLSECFGGGGGGNFVNGTTNLNFTGGGGAGYSADQRACLGGDILTYTVGQGGNGALSANNTGSAGGDSTISGTMTGGGSISMVAHGGAGAPINGTQAAGGTAAGGNSANGSGQNGTVGQPIAGKGGDCNNSGNFITPGSGGFNDTVSNNHASNGGGTGAGGGGHQSGAPAPSGGFGGAGIVSFHFT
jgi:hypothetical protein